MTLVVLPVNARRIHDHIQNIDRPRLGCIKRAKSGYVMRGLPHLGCIKRAKSGYVIRGLPRLGSIERAKLVYLRDGLEI